MVLSLFLLDRYFGISSNLNQNELIFASREKLSKNVNYEKSTDSIVYFYNFLKKKFTNKIVVKNLYDLHQITFFKLQSVFFRGCIHRLRLIFLQVKAIVR